MRGKTLLLQGMLVVVVCLSLMPVAFAGEPAFTSIPLGVTGGLMESNLSSYLLAPAGSTDFIALDAGTVLAGLRQARILESFRDYEIEIPADSDLRFEGWVLHNHIKAYLISHAHIDHVAGMVINAPDDSKKPIFGVPSTIDYIRDHLFNWKVWPNFGNEGEGFHLETYQYKRLTPGEPQAIDGTDMTATAFMLSHSAGYPSSAFLIESGGNQVVYFGDTGPDEVEECDKMQQVWTHLAPLVKAGTLKGIFLEVSYPDERPDNLLFGHLTPTWMLKELRVLANLVDPQSPETALKGLKVVVTHIKPSLKRVMPPDMLIEKQLAELNDLGVTFIIPEQGGRIEF